MKDPTKEDEETALATIENAPAEVMTFDVTSVIEQPDNRKTGRVNTVILFPETPMTQVDVLNISTPQVSNVWKVNHFKANESDPVKANKVVKDLIRIRIKGMRGFTAHGKLIWAFPTPEDDEQRAMNEEAMMRDAQNRPASFDPSNKEHRELAVKILHEGKLVYRGEPSNLWGVVLARETEEEKLVEKN